MAQDLLSIHSGGLPDNSVSEWHTKDDSPQINGAQSVNDVPNANAIRAEEYPEPVAQFGLSELPPTTTWPEQIGCLTSHVQRLRDILRAILNCSRNLMRKTDENNDDEESDNSSDTFGESLQPIGTSNGSYQQTGQDRVTLPTGGRIVHIGNGIVIVIQELRINPQCRSCSVQQPSSAQQSSASASAQA
jgi:hypothetical protein